MGLYKFRTALIISLFCVLIVYHGLILFRIGVVDLSTMSEMRIIYSLCSAFAAIIIFLLIIQSPLLIRLLYRKGNIIGRFNGTIKEVLHPTNVQNIEFEVKQNFVQTTLTGSILANQIQDNFIGFFAKERTNESVDTYYFLVIKNNGVKCIMDVRVSLAPRINAKYLLGSFIDLSTNIEYSLEVSRKLVNIFGCKYK